MKQNRLAIMAIPVLAAVLIGGSIAPAAYADHQNNAECDAIIENLIDAFFSGNAGKLNGMIKALEKTCLGFGAECDAHLDNGIRALDAGDIDRAIQQFDVFLAQDCI